jgi:phage terminase large subunit-like protein
MSALPKDFEDSLATLREGHDLSFLQELQVPPTIHVNADAKSLHKVLQLVQALNEAHNKSGMQKWFDPEGPYPISALPKHEAFFAAGDIYPERLFMASNRSGKSICGCFEDVAHVTGVYPDWWTGKRFDHPVDIWVVGPDAVTVRDTLQKELLGPLGEEGTGMISSHLLGKATGKQGVVGAVDKLRVRHVSGGWSTITFKNYKQDLQAFMGAAVHVVHLDEECPIEIWNECNIRTATTNGIMYATFTPLKGYSRMVVNFCKKADFLMGAKPLVASDYNDEDMPDGEELVGNHKRKAVIQCGWNDAPWLTEEVKARLLEDTPEHLREARSKGIPSMEGGSVFTTPLESVLCEPFIIPDNWPRMYGMDVGWNCTTAVWGALDPNTGTLYFYDEHYQGEQMPQHHAHAIKMRGEWIRGVIDPAADGRSQKDGTQLMRAYKELGLRLLPADNSLEAGLHKMNELFSTGRLKVFKTLRNFQKEYMLYKRKLNGSIDPHCDDHALDAGRYVVNNMQRMSSKAEHTRSSGIKYTPTGYDV